MPYTVSRTVCCREDRCFHFVSKMKGFAYILTLEKCRDFFENSNGKRAKGSLYKWKTKHLMGEYPFTQVVKALFTQAVHAFRGKMTMKMP